MATRDLTNQFLERRSAALRKRQQSSSNSGRHSAAAGTIRPCVSSCVGVVQNSPLSLSLLFHVSLADTDGGSYTKLAAGGGHDLMLAEEGGSSISIELSRWNGASGTTSSSQQPAWVADVDKVETCLLEIGHAMKELQSMHAQRVGSVFGKDLEDMERWIEKRTADVTDHFRFAERLLQKVGMATRRSGGQEATVGANVQRRCVIVLAMDVPSCCTATVNSQMDRFLLLFQFGQTTAGAVGDVSPVATKISG